MCTSRGRYLARYSRFIPAARQGLGMPAKECLALAEGILTCDWLGITKFGLEVFTDSSSVRLAAKRFLRTGADAVETATLARQRNASRI